MRDWLKLADGYLAANAAESGADELIRGLADILRSGVVVPVEPTEAMLDEMGDDGYNTAKIKRQYAAMLAAAHPRS